MRLNKRGKMKTIYYKGLTQPLSKKILITSTALLAILSSQTFAAGDNGSSVTLADLTAQGATIATEFTGDVTKHEKLANFAWREFIALNSPAGSLPANRGKPDSKRNFVDSGKTNFYSSGKTPGQLGTNLLVWESFAHRTELFPHIATISSPIVPFAKNPYYQFAPMGTNGKTPTFSDGVLQLYNNLDESSQIGQNIIFFPKNPPNRSTNPFDDSQLLFEAKVNETEYEYGQPLSSKTPVNLPANSVEVKAAWRRIIPGVDASRYHTAEAVYYTGDESAPVAKNATFGLVGLHIIQKTPNYPTFIFASFEHNDSLTLPNGDPSGLYYITNYESLGYDPIAGDTPSAVINNGSGTLVTTALPVANDNLRVGTGLPAGHAGPITITQPATITSTVTQVNTNVHSLMASSSLFNDSVWKNYSLKGVQAIPTNEQNPTLAPTFETLDYYLANIFIESSQPGVQLFKGGVIGPGNTTGGASFINNRESSSYKGTNAQNVTLSDGHKVTMGGCMGCHGQAQQAGVDFSFLFFSRGINAGFPADTVGEASPSVLMKRAQNYLKVNN